MNLRSDTAIFTDELLLPANAKVWGRVIFSEACVKNSVHRGGASSQVGFLWGGFLLGVLPLGGLPPGGASSGGASSWGCFLWGGAWWRPPGTATAAGGTHPTGMHSCFTLNVVFKYKRNFRFRYRFS